MVVSGGQCNDNTKMLETLDAMRVVRSGRGRPRKRPGLILGDKGYSYPSCRQKLRGRGLKHLIPERRDQRDLRTKKGQKARGGKRAVVPARLIRICTKSATWWSERFCA